MSTLLHWFTSPEWTQIVKALLHSLWQGALITVALAVFMRRLANPVSRYRCSLTALACVVVAGIITWAVMNASDGRAASSVQSQPTAENQNAHNFAATTDASPEDKIIVTANRTTAATSMRWTAWLALVWLAGAGVMLARAGVKVAGAERLRRSCQPLNDARVEKLLAKARRAIGLARQVRVGVTDKLTSPAVVGVFVPMLILPLSLLTTLTPEQIQFILLHELAHIRRGDYLANLFQFFAESLLFFNPAVWWISHQVRREREACCDALAIELSGAPVDYARTLVHVAENMLQPPPAAATAFSEKREPSSLIDRVQRLLVPGYRPSLRLTWRAMLVALVLGGILLVVSAVGTRTTVAAILTPKPPAVPVTNNSTPSKTLEQQYSETLLKFNQARSNLDEIARELNMPSDVYEATFSFFTKELEQTFQSESLRKYLPLIAARREWDSVRHQHDDLRMKLDSESGKFRRATNQEPGEIISEYGQFKEFESELNDLSPKIEKAKVEVEAVRTQLSFTNIFPWDEKNATEKTIKEFALYRGVRTRLTFLLLEQGTWTRRIERLRQSSEILSSLSTTNVQQLPVITNATSLVQDGKLLFEMGRRDQAEAKLKQAIAIEPDNQETRYYLDLIKNKATADFHTMVFKVDTNTGFANLQKLSGLPESSSLQNKLQKLFSEAGVKPPLTNILIYKEGILIVPGTKAQMDLVKKVVQRLNGVSSNDSRTLTNQNPNLAEADTLVQDGKLLFEMGKLDQAEAKLRKALDLDPQNNAAAYYLSLVHEARLNVATLNVAMSRRGSDAQTMIHTNLIYTSKGRQAIAKLLDRIHLDSIVFPEGGLPLSEVIRNLSKVSKDSDPEKHGINFIISSGVESAPAAAPVEGGGGLPPVPAEPLDLGAVIVKLNPGLTDVRLADVLDTITKNAEKPIKYAIEDYAVVFSLKTDADLQRLFGRSFKVDPNVMLSNLGKQTGLTSTNREEETKALVKIFSDAGVDLQPPKGIFYNDRGGVLVVRATKEDLDIVETVLQALNYSPPLIKIKTRFIEMPDALAQSLMKEFSVTNYLNNRGLIAVLTDPLARQVLKRFEQEPGVSILASPEVTTLSGRQAQIQIVDVQTIVTGINPPALTPPGITTTNKNDLALLYLIENMRFGTTLDVLPHLSADGYTIELTAIPKLTAFLGYDKPPSNVTTYVNGKKQSAVPPLPRFYSDQITNNAVVWDGQTLVLGGLVNEEVSKTKDKVPLLGDLPGIGRLFRSDSSAVVRKNLLVFITPTLIDPSGNRVHSDDEMPLVTTNAVPSQLR